MQFVSMGEFVLQFGIGVDDVFSAFGQRDARFGFDQRVVHEFVSVSVGFSATTVDFSDERMLVLDFVLVVVSESVDCVHTRGSFIDTVEVFVVRILILEHVCPVFAFLIEFSLNRVDFVGLNDLVVDHEVDDIQKYQFDADVSHVECEDHEQHTQDCHQIEGDVHVVDAHLGQLQVQVRYQYLEDEEHDPHEVFVVHHGSLPANGSMLYRYLLTLIAELAGRVLHKRERFECDLAGVRVLHQILGHQVGVQVVFFGLAHDQPLDQTARVRELQRTRTVARRH